MSEKIIQYAIIKAIYDKKENIVECFYPFFISTLDDGSDHFSLDLQALILNKFDIDIPIHVLQKLARLGEKNKHLSINDEKEVWPIRITDEGCNYRNTILDTRDTERRIGELVNGFINYLSIQGIIKEPDETRADIETYINKNTNNLSTFFFEYSDIDRNCFEDHEKEFTEYILEIEKNKPSIYAILKEMFYGSIISTSLKLSPNEFDGVVSSKFNNTKVYFDANYLFSLLGYHDEELNVPAKELYKLLRRFGFTLRVFDFTLSEMTHVLSNYIKNQDKYSSGVKVRSLYSVLKRKNYGTSDIIEIISKLEENLAELKIMKKNTNIDLEKYVANDAQLVSEVIRVKPHQSDFYRSHDICLIEKAISIRKKKYFNFENPESFIITSDFKLGQVCYKYYNHGSDSSISEIILDRTMTNILFLKDPSIDLSLSTIVSGFSTELFVDRGVWEKFYSILKQLKEKGEIDEDKISNLFYHSYIEDELLNCENSDIEDIDEQFVLTKIEDAASVKEKETTQKITDVENKYEEFIETKEQEYSRNLESIEFDRRLKIDQKAERESKQKVAIIRIIVGVLLLLPLIISIIDFIQTNTFSTTVMSIVRYGIFIIQTSIVSINKIWQKIYNFFFKIKKRKLERELL